MGKGSKPGVAAVTAETANVLLSLCYDSRIQRDARIFPFTRSQAFRIVQDAYHRAGVRQPSKATDHVGAIHALRHSGAIAGLKASGNPRSVQAQLRHKSASMTMRYLKTMSADESLLIQQQVSPW
jgi:integrase